MPEDFALLKLAHDLASNNRRAAFKSKICGCFCCLRTFMPGKIAEWIDSNRTAVCPHCGIDSVISSHDAGNLKVDLVSSNFLSRMRAYWFDNVTKVEVRAN